ncbi:MAG: DUF481 domain-containing protein [Gammaproteobacteria bacterium]
MTKHYAIVPAMFLLSSVALAENGASVVWHGEAELGFISTSGNTKTETLNTKAKITNERDRWKHTGLAEATRISDQEVVTAERYFLSGKTDYKYTDVSYLFGLLNYEDDRFSGYHYQASLIAGYGHKLINDDRMKLNAELGAGTRHNETLAGIKNDEGVVYGAMDMKWTISKSSSLNEKLTVESGSDATTTKSVTSLQSKINSKLASKITYTIKHVSAVPAGVEKTDRETAVTLVYSF